MPHTLVTGANSFVAAHIIQALVTAGHRVTGSVRRASAGEAVLTLHPEWKDHLDFVEIEDYAIEGVFDAVFKNKDFDYVIHVAAPFAVTSTDTEYERDFLLPGVGGYVFSFLLIILSIRGCCADGMDVVTSHSSTPQRSTPKI